MKHYTRVFMPTEVQMMLAAFSNMETVHIAAYAHLLDTIGIPETEYAAFLKYKEMKAKYDYMQNFNVKNPTEIARTLAVFGAFTEGLQLFASFAILMNFPRFGKMKGMGQIVTWSVRDETLHTLSIIRLFKTFIEENPEVWTDKFKAELYEACDTVIHHEDAFIDLSFELGGIRRHDGRGREAVYPLDCRPSPAAAGAGSRATRWTKNPLPWMDEILNGMEHANFFENRSTEYSRAATQGTWEEAFEDFGASREESAFAAFSADDGKRPEDYKAPTG
jgi:ribonucleoside-diphosphate reductase beta chain